MSQVKFLVAQSTSTEMEMTIEEFLLAKEQAGRTPTTIEKYRYNLDKFAVWMASEGITDPAQLTETSKKEANLVLRNWGASLRRRGQAPATVRQIIATIRSFLKWCYQEEIVTRDFATVLRMPVAKKRVQRTLMYDEILAMLNICDISMQGIRDRALINLLIDSGLRASEVCRLKVDDLTFGVRLMAPEGEVVINVIRVLGKGNNERLAYFGQEAARCLRIWLEVRENHLTGAANTARINGREFSKPDTVFVSLGGITRSSPLTVSGLRVHLRKLGERAGVEKVSTHAFRRSMACLAEYAGASSRETQLYGGWSTIEQVERYTQMYNAGQKFNQHSPADLLKRLKDRAGN
jgi:site-specific recombinase XerD